MTSLRCAEGIDTEYFKTRFGEQALMQVMGLAQRWIASGDLCFEQGWLKIPARRFLISDAIIESLFEV
jgi:oxygen-independent coproporphyrinogen-3 oxidase